MITRAKVEDEMARKRREVMEGHITNTLDEPNL